MGNSIPVETQGTVTPNGARLVPMLRRNLTFSVWFGASHVGYLRWTEDDTWRARSLGNADEAATMRTFKDQNTACGWLSRSVNGVVRRRASA